MSNKTNPNHHSKRINNTRKSQGTWSLPDDSNKHLLVDQWEAHGYDGQQHHNSCKESGIFNHSVAMEGRGLDNGEVRKRVMETTSGDIGRVRVVTQKSLEYQRKLHNDNRLKSMKRLHRLMRSMDPLFESAEHVGEIVQKLLQVDHLFFEVMESHGKYHTLIDDIEERKNSSKWMDENDTLVFGFKKFANERLSEFNKLVECSRRMSIDEAREGEINLNQTSNNRHEHSRLLPGIPDTGAGAPEIPEYDVKLPTHAHDTPRLETSFHKHSISQAASIVSKHSRAGSVVSSNKSYRSVAPNNSHRSANRSADPNNYHRSANQSFSSNNSHHSANQSVTSNNFHRSSHRSVRSLHSYDMRHQRTRIRSSSDPPPPEHTRRVSRSSHHSCRKDSSVSSKVSLYIEQKAKLASLRAEARFMKESKYVKGSETWEIEKEIAKAEAVADVYAAEEEGKSFKSEKVDPHSGTSTTGIGRVEESICKLLQLQTAPTVEIDEFDGNPLEFNYFIATFKEAVEDKVDDPRGRLTRLIKYTKGEAKDLIKNCIQEDPSTGYTHAMSLLKTQYGNPHFIARAYIKELHKWEPLKVGDSKAFRKFYGFLIKCKTCMSSGIYLKELDSPDILQVLQSKLPYSMQDKWNRRAVKLRTSNQREANFADFLEIVQTETMVANDPMYSREAMSNRPSYIATNNDNNKNNKNNNNNNNNNNNKNKGNGNNNNQDGGVSNFSVGIDQTTQKTNDQGELKENCSPCVCCQQNHDLDDCPEYKKLNIKGRKAFLFKKRLCFCCYKSVSPSHTAQLCTKKRKCAVCNELHPTSLHVFPPKQEESEGIVNVATGCKVKTDDKGSKDVNQVISLCIVPVNVRHKSNPNNVMTVYAMLDNCSEGTFVTEEVVEMLEAMITPTSISIKTLNGTVTHSSSSTEGLQVSAVCDLDGKPPQY